jgi:hypothetical protein
VSHHLGVEPRDRLAHGAELTRADRRTARRARPDELGGGVAELRAVEREQLAVGLARRLEERDVVLAQRE